MQSLLMNEHSSIQSKRFWSKIRAGLLYACCNLYISSDGIKFSFSLDNLHFQNWDIIWYRDVFFWTTQDQPWRGPWSGVFLDHPWSLTFDHWVCLKNWSFSFWICFKILIVSLSSEKVVHFVDLDERFTMIFWSLRSASIQPITCHSGFKDCLSP